MVLAEEVQEGTEGTHLEDMVAASWGVSGDVSERPNGLLPDVKHGGRQEVDELWDSASLDDYLSVVSGTGSNVC